MPIVVIQNKTPEEIHQDVAGFEQPYVEDWRSWLAGPALDLPKLFGARIHSVPNSKKRPRRSNISKPRLRSQLKEQQ
jgi:hypothetical protein